MSLLLEAPSLVSRGKAALVSATVVAAADEDWSAGGGSGAKAGSASDGALVTKNLLGS